MTDPMVSLNGLRAALDERVQTLRQFQPCELHAEFRVMLVKPAPGATRFTYAKLDAPFPKTIVQAVASFLVPQPIEGVPFLCRAK
jgi:hypothetical protein